MSETAIQVIGYIASVVIVLSLCFPTHTRKSTLMLRIINLIGSAFFMAYGILTNTIPTAVLNGATIVVDIVQIVLLYVKKPPKDSIDENVDETNNNVKAEENHAVESEE